MASTLSLNVVFLRLFLKQGCLLQNIHSLFLWQLLQGIVIVLWTFDLSLLVEVWIKLKQE